MAVRVARVADDGKIPLPLIPEGVGASASLDPDDPNVILVGNNEVPIPTEQPIDGASNRIQLRRETTATWTALNPVLRSGEPAYDSTTGFFRIGDGITAYLSLPSVKFDSEAIKALLPTDNKRAVGKGELVFNVIDFGADRTGKTSSGAAILAAVNAARLANVTDTITGAANRTAPRAPIIYFPAGVYDWDQNVFADLQPTTSEASTDKTRLTFRGDGSQSSVLNVNASLSGTALSLTRGSVTMEGLQFNGKSLSTATFVQLGAIDRTSDYMNQSVFRDVHFTNGGAGSTYLRLAWAYDLAFYDCHFRSIGLGGIMVDVPSNPNDNVNNVLWARCHWENGRNATFIRTRSTFASSGIHTSWTFDQCHWEARAYNTRAIDAEGVSRWTFISPHMPQNDVITGSPVPPEETVNWIRLVNASYITVLSGGITRQGTKAAHARKLLSLGGYIRGFEIRNTMLDPATTGASNSKAAVWEEDSVVPLTANKGFGGLQLTNCSVGGQYATETEVMNDSRGLQDSASTWAWNERVDPTSKALIVGNGNTGNDIATSRVDRVTYDSAGGLTLNTGSMSPKQKNVVTGTSQTFTIETSSGSNPNKRGMYLVYANTSDATAWAIVFSTGAALSAVTAGAGMVVSTTDSATASKFSVFLTGTSLTVFNRTGTDRPVSVLMFGFSG